MIGSNPSRRKAALVTGASSGIGAEFAKILAKNGYDLVLVARRIERLEQLATELGQRYAVGTTVIPADLSESTSAHDVYSQVRGRGIEIDILVNNAGFNVYGPFTETDLEDEERMLRVNVTSVVALTKPFVRDMVRRGSGKILNLGSTGSFAPAPLDSLYAASKAFVLSFSEALAEELRGTGVAVTVLCPGPTKTEFAVKAGMLDTKIFSGRLMTPEQVAATGFDALMRGRTTVVMGLANKLQVWSLRFAPRSLVARVGKSMLSKRGVSLETKAHHA